jgi:hypothetical protein
MSNNTFAKWLLKAVVVALLAVPAVAQAQDARGLWMATSSRQASLSGTEFGRLALANGVLSFQGTKFEWRLALSDVKRIAPSKLVSNAIEVESVTGQVYFVGILDGQLSVTSPGKAVQAIQRAVRTAPAPAAPARTVVAAASGIDQP